MLNEETENVGRERRVTWAKGWQAKKEEDRVYSLMGLLDVHMVPLYGEGVKSAISRLSMECVQQLELDEERHESGTAHLWARI
jgi:hypothetical protein